MAAAAMMRVSFDLGLLLDRWPRSAFASHRFPAIGCASSSDELNKIGRLRYDLFIERDGKAYSGANHRQRSFLELIDGHSLNFQVVHHGEPIAAVRLTRAKDALADEHLVRIVEHAGLNHSDLRQTVVNSRLAVRPDTRARLQIPLLFRHMYRIGVLSGAAYCLVAARPDVGPLFEKFGFKKRSVSYVDPVGGLMEVHVLDVFDKAALLGGFDDVLAEMESSGELPLAAVTENANA
ncbi:MAG: hypothetical protein FD152_4137 [Xanthobacteraceae bacterium]|nr:MAG: hypothetical protein FD152_4137 [Xanthobacteraceae bacterium]